MKNKKQCLPCVVHNSGSIKQIMEPLIAALKKAGTEQQEEEERIQAGMEYAGVALSNPDPKYLAYFHDNMAKYDLAKEAIYMKISAKGISGGYLGDRSSAADFVRNIKNGKYEIYIDGDDIYMKELK